MKHLVILKENSNTETVKDVFMKQIMMKFIRLLFILYFFPPKQYENMDFFKINQIKD